MTETTANPFEGYDEKIAASDLRKYRDTGPRPWAKALVDALTDEGVEGATVLNIGGGVGVIQFEPLAAGASRATMVEVSSAYLDAAHEERPSRLGPCGVVREWRLHRSAEAIPPADIVTLERVLNVYPDWERLAAVSAGHARRLFGVVVPRDRLFVKGMIGLINLRLRLQGKSVRARVIPVAELERVLRGQGLTPHSEQTVGPAWLVAVFRRPEEADGGD